MTPPLFDILSQETPLLQNRFLEASAGSGKTFTIENLFVRLVLEQDEIDFREIIIMTFTKKGCYDLRKRIRGHLLAIEKALVEGDFSIPYLQLWKDQTKKPLGKIRETLLFFEEVPIFTLHGFCHSLLQDSGILVGGSLSLADEKKIAPLLRRHLDHLEGCSHAEIRRLQNYPSLAKEVAEKAFSNSRWNKRTPLSKILLDLSLDGEKVCADFFQNEEFFNKRSFNKELLLRFCAIFSNTTIDDPFTVEEWKSIKKMCSPSSFKKGFSSFTYYPHFFHRCEEVLFPYIEVKCSFPHLLAHFFSEVQGKLLKIKEKEGWITYEDLLSKTDQALLTPSFLDTIQSRYRFAIVDEFQDTDPLQWSILKKIFLHEGRYLFLVGDPKQAIYSFRGADVYTFLEAKRALGNTSVATLGYNFRSHHTLVSAQNNLFQGDFLSLPKMDSFLPFHPAIAAKSHPCHLQDGKGALHWVFPVTPLKEADLLDFVIPFIAHEVLHLQKQGIAWEEIAILVDTHTEGEKIEQGLSALNIPSVLASRNERENPFAEAIKEAFLEAFQRPETAATQKKIGWLILGFEESELTELDDLEKRGLFTEALLFLKKIWELSPVRFYEELLSLRLHPNGLSLRAHLAQTRGGKKVKEALLWLQKKESQQSSLEQLLHTPQASDLPPKGKISIVTLHSSKGLEFEVVFAPGLFWGRRAGVDLQNLELSEELRKKEIEAERLRLLYVGLTRAKERLYLPLYKSHLPSPFFLLMEKKGVPFEKEALIEYAQKEKISFEIFSSKTAARPHTKEEKIVLHRPSLPTITEKPIPYRSFSSLIKEKKPYRPRKVDKKPEIEGGTYLGTILHEILEKIPIQGDHETLRSLVEERIERTPWRGEGEALFSWIGRALKAPFLPKGKSLSECNESEVIREGDFGFIEEDSLYRGTIDLFGKIDEDYFLVDWKSHALDPAITEDELAQFIIEEGYSLQASLYRKCMEKTLQSIGVFTTIPFTFFFLRSGRWITL